MNHPQYNYKALDPDLDEYLSEYKNQTPLESDHYAGELFPLGKIKQNHFYPFHEKQIM